MRRHLSTVLVAATVLTFAAVAPASAAPEVTRRGACSDGATWKIELDDHGARIEVNFEVHHSPDGDTWGIRMRHDGDVFFRGTRTANSDGEFDVDRRVADHSGTDRFVARAHDRSTSEVCTGAASI
jgi:hypothetical protein